MPVPSYRVPVRVARGTLAALTTGLSSLQEGELCYATDEDALYVVEGGVLTATGSSVGALSDLSDVSISVTNSVNYTSFDPGQTLFTDPDAGANAGAVDATEGPNSWKVLPASTFGDGSGLIGFLGVNKRYDVVNFRIRSSNNIDTNNRVSLGGNKQDLDDSSGFTLYTRDTGFGFYGDNSFEEIGSKPSMLANTWYEITYVLDWGGGSRTSTPIVSLWVDGSIAVNSETPSVTYTELTGVDALDFRIVYSSSTNSNAGDKYWDDISVVTADTIPWSMTDPSITDPAVLMNAEYTTTSASDGDVLKWVDASNSWEAAAASASVAAIDDLTDVDTTTVAPVDGQALVWDNSNSEWKPGDVASSIEWNLTANGTSDYIFAGPGFAGTETDPTIYVTRGQTYKFTNLMDAHPFQIQSTQGTSGTAYSDGITNNAVSNGTLTWEVRMDAPSTLYYQCTAHALMAGTIYVLDEGIDGATTIDELADVDTTTATPTNNQVLTWDGANWVPADASGATTIDELADVDTTTAAPTNDQVLAWDGTNWIPADAATGGASTINDLTDVDTTTTAPTNDQVLAWNGTNWVPTDAASGGSGGGGSSAARLSESQTAASGVATFVGIGHSGTLVDITSSLDAWVVLYDSAASRTADSGRAYATDPAPGSGVLAEFYITAAGTVLATPGTTYFNNDTSVTEAIYAAVRDQAGANVNSAVTITAYGNQTVTSVSGGTFGSGV